MSIQAIDRPKQTASQELSPKLPALQSGDHLSRAEFERRYQAHPEIKAELIEGAVYVSSPTRVEHGEPHFNIIVWLGTYQAATPGVAGSDNVTVRLDLENEPQPDVLLRLEPDLGGQTRISDDGYLQGSPELVVEIAASSASYDLHTKQRVYARNGVPEYLVLLTYEQEVKWFILREGVYVLLGPDENGILRSEMFPGLWLQPAALWSGNLAAVLATVQQGLASTEHTTFVEQLAAKRQESQSQG